MIMLVFVLACADVHRCETRIQPLLSRLVHLMGCAAGALCHWRLLLSYIGDGKQSRREWQRGANAFRPEKGAAKASITLSVTHLSSAMLRIFCLSLLAVASISHAFSIQNLTRFDADEDDDPSTLQRRGLRDYLRKVFQPHSKGNQLAGPAESEWDLASLTTNNFRQLMGLHTLSPDTSQDTQIRLVKVETILEEEVVASSGKLPKIAGQSFSYYVHRPEPHVEGQSPRAVLYRKECFVRRTSPGRPWLFIPKLQKVPIPEDRQYGDVPAELVLKNLNLDMNDLLTRLMTQNCRDPWKVFSFFAPKDIRVDSDDSTSSVATDRQPQYPNYEIRPYNHDKRVTLEVPRANIPIVVSRHRGRVTTLTCLGKPVEFRADIS